MWVWHDMNQFSTIKGLNPAMVKVLLALALVNKKRQSGCLLLLTNGFGVDVGALTDR
jgi:hypothetical protein